VYVVASTASATPLDPRPCSGSFVGAITPPISSDYSRLTNLLANGASQLHLHLWGYGWL
jgi:hypothetical protein